MTIKKKIRLSNIFMVLLPVSLSLLTVAVCLQTSLGNYWYSLETMYKDENGIQSAQSLIYTYQQKLWENNWGFRLFRGMINRPDIRLQVLRCLLPDFVAVSFARLISFMEAVAYAK